MGRIWSGVHKLVVGLGQAILWLARLLWATLRLLPALFRSTGRVLQRTPDAAVRAGPPLYRAARTSGRLAVGMGRTGARAGRRLVTSYQRNPVKWELVRAEALVAASALVGPLFLLPLREEALPDPIILIIR